MQYLISIFLSASLTIIIETPVMVLGCMGYRDKIRMRDLVTESVIINLITNLLMNASRLLIIMIFNPTAMTRLIFVMLAEVAVYFSEYFMFKDSTKGVINNKWLAILVFVANLISVLSGIIIFGVTSL